MTSVTGIVVLVLAATGLSACGGGHDAPAPEAVDPIDVTVSAVATVDLAERLEAGGVVAAEETASVSSRTVATIASVRVKAGDRVRPGDVLVTLDARDVVGHTERGARQRAGRGKSAGAGAERDGPRRRLSTGWRPCGSSVSPHCMPGTLPPTRNVTRPMPASQPRLRGRQGPRRQSRWPTRTSRPRARRSAPRRRPSRMPPSWHRSPAWSPSVSPIPAISPHQASRSCGSSPTAHARSSRASTKPAWRTCTPAIGWRLRSTEQASLPPAAKPFEGVIAEVARAVGADQRAFTVKVTLPPTVTARSGTFARVVFRGAPRRALVAPADGIHRYGQVTSVYVVQDGVARLRLIQAGPSSASGVEILAGLDAGESIVTSPIHGLADGARVAIGPARRPPGDTP